jgi:hypothetical protein
VSFCLPDIVYCDTVDIEHTHTLTCAHLISDTSTRVTSRREVRAALVSFLDGTPWGQCTSCDVIWTTLTRLQLL